MDMVIPEAFRVSPWRTGRGPANSGVEVQFLDQAVRERDANFNGLEVVRTDFPYAPKDGEGPLRWDLYSAQLDYAGSKAHVQTVANSPIESTVEVIDSYTMRVKPPASLTINGREYVEKSKEHGVVIRARTNVGEIWAQQWGETIKEQTAG